MSLSLQVLMYSRYMMRHSSSFLF